MVPGTPDEETATLAAVVAALGPRGAVSTLRGRGLGAIPVIAALRDLGVSVERRAGAAGGGLSIVGTGGALAAPRRPIDCGDSPAALAALTGWLSALPIESTVDADEAVARRHLFSIARALRQRGALIEGRLEPKRPRELGAPCVVGPATQAPSPLELALAAHEPLAKTAALVSGLFANGETRIVEPLVTSDFCERILVAAGAKLRAAGPHLLLEPIPDVPIPRSLDEELPASPSSAAGLVLAALAVPMSRVGVRRVVATPPALGWLESLRDAGAALHLEAKPDACGVPTLDVIAVGPPARALVVGGERAARAAVALPLLAAMAATAPRGTACRLDDLPCDRETSAATERMLTAFGVSAAWTGQGLDVVGQAQALTACELDADGDPELAMAAAALALGARGTTVIHGAEALLRKHPRFVSTLRALGAAIDASE